MFQVVFFLSENSFPLFQNIKQKIVSTHNKKKPASILNYAFSLYPLIDGLEKKSVS